MVRSIVLAKIYFTDLSAYKLRPILIIKKYKDEDFLFLPLTTNLKVKGIKITSKNLDKGELKAPSVIIHPKINTIHKSLIIKKIGHLNQETFDHVIKVMCLEFKCDKLI